jgi:thymidylate synthase (FAD)
MSPITSTNQSSNSKIFLPDGIGFIELLDSFGDDLTVVNAARVSFHKESHEMTEGDTKLINYLAKHEHVSPFFHPQARFRIKMPIFVAREWFRHTIGFARNEVSRRYVDTPPECWIPLPNEIRERDPKAKQGSKSTPVEESEEVHKLIAEQTNLALETYNGLLARGVAPEVARGILPQSMYTEFVETASLFAYARLCNLRLDLSAQKEIRDYATMIHNFMNDAFPASWKALSSTFKGNDKAV